MNKNFYRLVFNHARNAIMVVSEYAAAQGKAKGEGATTSAISDSLADNAFPLSRMVNAIGFIFGMIVLVPAQAAGVVADPSAPQTRQPTVLSTGNGVPVVNIQTPSTAGVSRNTYTQFDVSSQGVILNNAHANVQTQLGGWVQGNPWLAGSTARVILNEVNSSNPSQLNGFIEVAGSRAQVVIANPAGIGCNGCGFINASRATLTTGTPILSGGGLDGYLVRGGTVSISGRGMNAESTDFTDIIARAVEVNAGLWANDLRITAGTNRVDAGNTQVTAIAGSGSAPAYAVDVAQLGGMYAGKIRLIGTEAGVGVRNAGMIGASAGQVALTAEGQLVNSGTLSGLTGNTVQAQGVTNSGNMLSGGAMVLDANTLANSGFVKGGDTRIHAGVLDNSGTISGNASNAVEAQNINNTGNLLSEGALAIDGATLANRGLVNGGDTFINADTLDNLGAGKLYGDHLAIAADTLTNRAETVNGTINAPVIAARTQLDLGVGTLTNDAGGLIFSAGDLAIGGSLDANHEATGETTRITNTSAAIEALGNLAIDAGELINNRTEFSTRRILSPDLPEGLALLPYNPALEFFWPYDETNPVNWRNFVRDQYINSINNLLGGTLSGAYRNQLEAMVDALPRSIYEDSINIWNRLLSKINTDHPEYIATMATALSGQHFPLRSYEQECDDTQCDYVNYIVKQRTDYKDVVTSTAAAASILAGGNASLTIGTLRNEYSSIEAGGDMALTGSSLTNVGAELFLQTDTITTTHRLHWVDRDHGTTTESSSTSTLIGSAPGIVSAGGDLTGSFTDRIDNLTIRENTAPLTAISGATPAGPGTIAVGGGSLFSVAPATTAGYLIETDPRFASYRTWLSSDFMQQQLSFDPAITQKRLGDGFYEQRLLREQIAQLTGRRFLTGYADDETQYRALMNHALTVADSLQLIPGVALSAAQMAQLTSDIVWLVQENVTLPDGATTQALVPRVYVRPHTGDLAPSGALLAGQNVHLRVTGDPDNATGTLTTSGTIAGRNIVTLDAANIDNIRGLVTGRDVTVAATQDLTLDGGAIAAEDRLIARASRDLTVKSSTVDLDVSATTPTNGVTARVQSHVIDRVAGLYVSNPDALLVASAGQDLNLMAAVIQNSGDDLDADQGGTRLTAGRDLNLGTVTQSGHASATTQNSWRKESWTTQTGSQIQTTGDLTLTAQRDLTATAAQITSEEGAITGKAGRDLTLNVGTDTASSDAYRKIKKSGTFGSSKTQHWDSTDQTTHTGTTLSGDSVTLSAGSATTSGNLTVAGSQVVATNDVKLTASGDVTLTTVADTYDETHRTKKTGSGFSVGTGSLSYGTQKLATTDDTTQVIHRGSTVGSLEGDVTIESGKTYTQTGSDVLALKGDIDIAAQRVDITAAIDTTTHAQTTKFKQTGVTLAISNPVLSAAQTTQQMATAASQTDDPRMQALAAGTTALAVSNAYDAVAANPDQAGGVNLSLSLGTQQSSSRTTQTSTTAVGSRVQAGGDVTITAEGAGERSDITVIGSQITAGHDLTLMADDAINLLAAQNTSTLDSSNKNSSASVGVSFGIGIGGKTNGFAITAGASLGRGNADGHDTTWSETGLQAGNTLTLISGGDTTLKGATAEGKQVIADIGGNLTLQSLQDTSTYDAEQKSAGFSVSIPIGAGNYGGSISLSHSETTSDYASVIEQTAIKAGDNGFQIDVKGNTSLTGAVIASTQTAIDQNKNSLETGTLSVSDIANHAEYEGESMSVTAGVGQNTAADGSTKNTPTASAGFASLEGSASSITQSAISGGAITLTNPATQQTLTGQDATTTLATLNRDVHVDANGNTVDSQGNSTAQTLATIFDQEKVQRELDAQVQITQAFSQVAPKAVADYAQSQYDKLKTSDPEEAAKWAEGGIYRIALHTAVGGLLSGDLAGALGAGVTASVAPLLEDLQQAVADQLQTAGLGSATANTVSQALAELTSLGIGTVTGGTAGATTALVVDTNNRQLHIEEISLIKRLAKERAQASCNGNADCEARTQVAWADLLERVAEGLVDDQANEKNLQYLGQVINSATIQGSNGSWGGVEGYLSSWQEAYNILSAYNSQQITINGQPIISAGTPQTYFSATESQRANTYINEFLGQPPGKITPGKVIREAEFLDYLQSPNGSATNVYPIEEFTLGTLGTNAAFKEVAKAWAGLGVKLAGETAASITGNISAQQVTEAGIQATLTNMDRTILADIAKLPNTTLQGDAREIVVNNYFTRNGFTSLDGKCGVNCFDGVFLKGDKVYVVETKPLNADGSIKLSSGDGDLPRQMSNDWIRSRAQVLINSGDPKLSSTGQKVLQAIDNGKLRKVVAGADSDGVTFVRLSE